jgi:hypothetical protein
VCFSLETASDYVKDEKACFYGFRCTIVGYEWPSSLEQVCKTAAFISEFPCYAIFVVMYILLYYAFFIAQSSI